jgi:hypothetical protein
MGKVNGVNYDDVRDAMQPGDVIAFGGRGGISSAIKWFTRGPVSHVGVVLQTKRPEENTPGYFNLVAESTSLDGFTGVTTTKLSKRLAQYDGEVWWLQLSIAVREQLNLKAFVDFLMEQDHKPYDARQAIYAGLDRLGWLTRTKEDFGKFFCSELVAAALEAGGVTGPINASEVTPRDLTQWIIYEDDYFQLKGSALVKIPEFNTVSTNRWKRG